MNTKVSETVDLTVAISSSATHAELQLHLHPLLLMIHSNTLSTVIVHGLVRKDNVFIPQTFRRGVSKPGEIWDASWTRPGGFPERPSSNLPPPGNEHLHIALGEILGSGRVGTVHEFTHNNPDPDLPPLVVKISRRRRSESMEQEAWFYEELEQVQGIAIPRCYGLFQAHVEEGAEVLTWHDRSLRDPEEVDEWGHPIIKKETKEDPTLLSILILERLGWGIPLGFKNFDYSPIKTDVYEIYNDLARMGIEHVDFRWSNVLCVIPDPVHGFSGPVCPHHGHPHIWRVIDFDLARKTNCNVQHLEDTYGFYLSRMFNNAPRGIVVEPWE